MSHKAEEIKLSNILKKKSLTIQCLLRYLETTDGDVYLVHTGPSCLCLCEPPGSSVYQLYSAWSCSADYFGGPKTTFQSSL